MLVKVSKSGDKKYSLEIKSGHFSGVLNSIPEESINQLISALQEMKNGEPKMVRVWNPRSQRHEMTPVGTTDDNYNFD